MTPRSKIETLEADDTVADLVVAAIETGYSRFPIVEGDLDETIGIVHVKQVFEVPPDDTATRPGWPAWRSRSPVVPSTLDGDAVMAQVARQRPADRAGGRRVRRHRGHGDRGGPDRGDRRRRPRRARRRDPRRASRAGAAAGRCRVCCASTRWPRPPDSARPEGEYETIGGLVLQELGHIPEDGRVGGARRRSIPTAPLDDPVRWLATVVRMDGRRIDLLELTKLGQPR